MRWISAGLTPCSTADSGFAPRRPCANAGAAHNAHMTTIASLVTGVGHLFLQDAMELLQLALRHVCDLVLGAALPGQSGRFRIIEVEIAGKLRHEIERRIIRQGS